MSKVKFLRVFVSLLLLYAIGGGEALSQGHSSGQASSPTVQVKSTVDQTIKILTDPGLQGDAQRDERHRLARKVILLSFDFNAMAKRSLGSHWRHLTPEKRHRFVSLFTQFLEKIYLARIDEFNGEEFFYTSAYVDHGYAEVTSEVFTSDGKEFNIRYKLHLVGNDWKIYDVVVEDISVVNNYRSQFNRIITKSSYEELVSRMEQKLAEDEKTSPIAKAPANAIP